jgi:hypothetical protein
MITVEINSQMKEKAQDYSYLALESLKKQGKVNYTGLDTENRYYCGNLGELVFLELLRSEEKRVIYSPNPNGNSDVGDFIVFGQVTGQQRTVDVKTACKSFHSRIMLPQKQWQKADYDYYVGVKLNGDIGEVYGYCKKKDFVVESGGFNDQNVVTRYKYLADLEPIEKFLTLIRYEKDQTDQG